MSQKYLLTNINLNYNNKDEEWNIFFLYQIILKKIYDNNLIKINIIENNKVLVLENNNKDYFDAKFKEISYEFFDKVNNIIYKCIMDIKGDVHLINPLNNKHIMYTILNKNNNNNDK